MSKWPTPRARRPFGRSGLSALGRDRGVALAARGEALLAQTVALGIELLVGQAALVQARSRLVQLGLSALARGDLLGLLGARRPVGGAIAMCLGDLGALARQLALAGLGARARHGDRDQGDHDDGCNDDDDDRCDGHLRSFLRWSPGRTRRPRWETADACVPRSSSCSPRPAEGRPASAAVAAGEAADRSAAEAVAAPVAARVAAGSGL